MFFRHYSPASRRGFARYAEETLHGHIRGYFSVEWSHVSLSWACRCIVQVHQNLIRYMFLRAPLRLSLAASQLRAVKFCSKSVLTATCRGIVLRFPCVAVALVLLAPFQRAAVRWVYFYTVGCKINACAITVAQLGSGASTAKDVETLFGMRVNEPASKLGMRRMRHSTCTSGAIRVAPSAHGPCIKQSPKAPSVVSIRCCLWWDLEVMGDAINGAKPCSGGRPTTIAPGSARIGIRAMHATWASDHSRTLEARPQGEPRGSREATQTQHRETSGSLERDFCRCTARPLTSTKTCTARHTRSICIQ